MKNTQLLSWLLIAFLAFQFTSCGNEPLEGLFPQDDGVNNAEIGEFIAKVNGVNFTAESASGILTDNVLVISGLKATTGESISLSVEGATTAIYDLTSGTGGMTFGVYVDSDTQINPYITYVGFGGDGELTITELDTDALTVTGMFNFIAGRIALDGDGNPIIDGSGNPVIETIEITAGSFNTIPYVIEGGAGNENPLDEFYAKVDGIEFYDETIDVSLTTVAGVSMLNIVATDINGAVMRIDIPEELGVGTFSFGTPISNGTDLIAMYNAGTGGENLTSGSGTITITEFGTSTGRVSATFSFVGTDPLGIDPTIVNVTEGDFSIDYIVNSGDHTNLLEAEVDGVVYSADIIEIVQTTVSGIRSVWITTEDTVNTQFIRLTFPEAIELGSYEMTTDLILGDEKIALFIPDTVNPMNFKSETGTLTIISYDTVSGIIEGTFEFMAVDTTGQDPTVYTIANGVFAIQIEL